MRKLLGALSVVGLVGSAFAQQDAPATLVTQLASSAETAISDLGTAIGPILIAAFGLTVAFVAYKLIKRATNKA